MENICAFNGNIGGLTSRIASFKEDIDLKLTLACFLDYFLLNPSFINKFSTFSGFAPARM